MTKLTSRVRKKINTVLKVLPAEEKDRMNKMLDEDGQLLIDCLTIQHERGTPFDIDFIEKHFRLTRLVLQAAKGI
jgi:hypothetical protein